MQTGLHLAHRIKNNSFFSSRLFNKLLNKSLLKSGKCTSDYIHYLLDNAAIIQLITGCIEKSDNFSCHYLFVMNARLDYIGSIPKTRSKSLVAFGALCLSILVITLFLAGVVERYTQQI